MSKRQTEVFTKFEANNWFSRNKEAMRSREADSHFVLEILSAYKHTPRVVLDVGCANGYLLSQLRQRFGVQAYGVDISAEAIADGRERYKDVDLHVAACTDLTRFQDGQFDLVLILGVFCVVDRSLLLRSIGEVDRVLCDKGILIISDFAPAFASKTPYHHLPGENIFTYKQDYAATFTASNLYTEAGRWSFDYSTREPSFGDRYNDRYNYVALKKDLNLYAGSS